RVYEPRSAWSVTNLVREHGEGALEAFRAAYPALAPIRYEPDRLDIAIALGGADVALVHEWNDPELVGRIGEHRRRTGAGIALFHDTHHRAATEPKAMSAYDLSGYDAVVAFGRVVADIYLARGWARRAFVWHEAADARVFRPRE